MPYGEKALHLAARQLKPEYVALLARGADPHARAAPPFPTLPLRHVALGRVEMDGTLSYEDEPSFPRGRQSMLKVVET